MKRKLNKVFPIQKDSSPAAFSKMVTSREELLVNSIADIELQTKPLDEDASPHEVMKRIFARRTTSKMDL